ncbi:MAG: 4-hydroxy-tetrahydrodipicolinate synthase [Actinomycetota bacterium]|nr:4-hydroxy-tetrahydrodipicolinate synthase [Actinomycetota bacterium]
MARSGAVITAMVTPFAADGSLDLPAAAELAEWLIDQGNDGLVLAGTTGESPTLSDDEKLDLWRAVRAAVDVPLIAGSTSNDTAHSVELTRAAAGLGMDGILAVTPYYNRPSQAGIEAHFRAIAEASSLPVILYDIPVRTGRKIATATIVRLAEDVPTIAGVKDAAGDPAETARLIAATPDDFELYSGDDALNLPFLAVGAVGVISVAAHWTAGLHRELVDAVIKGDMEAAQAVNHQLLPSYGFETSEAAPNPVPTKAMLRVLGHAVGECRLPMGPTPDGLEAEARELAADLELLTSR